MSSKPILFNTKMVKAILDGRKTQFRIPVNVSSDCTYYASGINKTAISSNFNNFEAIFVLPKDKWKNSLTPKLGYFSSCYKDGDIIFVQEDWKVGGWNNTSFAFDHSCEPFDKSWHNPPSKENFYDLLRNTLDELEAMKYPNKNGEYKWEKFKSPLKMMDKSTMQDWMARIFLKVTNVRVERLQDISDDDCIKEGISEVGFYPDEGYPLCTGYMAEKDDGKTALANTPQKPFSELWNSTTKKGYKWEDNPYVFVYEFERIEKQ
ncbi:hypothetical protein L5F42_02640 [Aliarcobacter butzleri]|uniref:hypothetical protein n=1 Tax=Aliarcobacter butzleri TaxID=28197 RepID=UPI001EE11FF7|nr:hypothetical protein [Aliarcobacter butzleri]MCG3698732.1 hypothetical protein [Aliarcobacter butzleri]